MPSHRVKFADVVGKGHVRLTLGDGGGGSLKAIAFKAADTPLGAFLMEKRGETVHVAGALSLDTWQGRESVQLRVLCAFGTDTRGGDVGVSKLCWLSAYSVSAISTPAGFRRATRARQAAGLT